MRHLAGQSITQNIGQLVSQAVSQRPAPDAEASCTHMLRVPSGQIHTDMSFILKPRRSRRFSSPASTSGCAAAPAAATVLLLVEQGHAHRIFQAQQSELDKESADDATCVAYKTHRHDTQNASHTETWYAK